MKLPSKRLAHRRRTRRLTMEQFERRNLLATVELLPIADNTLFEDGAGTLSNGAGEYLFAGKIAPRGGNELRRGLIRFDLDSLPAGATVNSVSVELNMSRTIAGDQPVALHTVLADWGEGASDAPRQEGTGTASQLNDATWIHRNFPNTSWAAAGGDFTQSASSTIQVGGNGRYTWSSDQLKTDVANWLANPSTNFGWILIGNEQTSTTAKRFDTRENATVANRPKLVIDYDVAAIGLDFGDAPTAAQSGFANDYPVTVAQDGARHTEGSLVLGIQIDSEADGLPTADASGDGADEDGVTFVTSLVTAPVSTTSSLSVVASSSGKLDAWIDFNRDGDWDDTGEQIFSSAIVSAGENVLPIAVPADASPGDTAIRLRLSSAGGLAPTGAAQDGEVEDYLVTLLSGDSSPDVVVQMTSDPLTLSSSATEVFLQSAQTDRFRAAWENVGSLAVEGTAGDDSLTIDLGTGFPVPLGGLRLSGGSGDNSLGIIGAGKSFDLSDPMIDASDWSKIDLSSEDATTLTIDADAIAKLSPNTKRIEVVASESDRIVVTGSANWRMTDPIVVNSQFRVTATHQNGSGEMIEALVAHPWQNLVEPSDVTNDGTVSSLDALVIINELGRRSYGTPNGDLFDPLTVQDWPGQYFDQNADHRATALDALRVINALSLQSLNDQNIEGELTPQSARDFNSSSISELSPGLNSASNSASNSAARELSMFLRRSPSSIDGPMDGETLLSSETPLGSESPVTRNEVERSQHERTHESLIASQVDELLSDQSFVS